MYVNLFYCQLYFFIKIKNLKNKYLSLASKTDLFLSFNSSRVSLPLSFYNVKIEFCIDQNVKTSKPSFKTQLKDDDKK